MVQRTWLLALAVAALGLAQPAAAHKVHVFAAADGQTIRGQAYVRASEPVRQAKVEVFDAQGQKLGETVTDKDGAFCFRAMRRTDHRFVVHAGEGHVAEYTVLADELPAELEPGTGPKAGQSEPASEKGASPASPHPAPNPPQAIQQELEGLRRQIVALRQDLDRFEHRTRYQDLVAGIGYILGLLGVAFYVRGMLRKEPERCRPPNS